MKRLIVMMLCIVNLPAYAGDWKKIDGTYAITGEHLIDPSSNEKNNTHLRFTLNNQSAKDLYNAMQVEPKKDECTQRLSKQVGDMICYYGKTMSDYECHFSINIKKQTVEYGLVC